MTALSDALPFDKIRFFRLYTGIRSFVPRDRFFSEQMEESPQIIMSSVSLIIRNRAVFLSPSVSSSNSS